MFFFVFSPTFLIFCQEGWCFETREPFFPLGVMTGKSANRVSIFPFACSLCEVGHEWLNPLCMGIFNLACGTNNSHLSNFPFYSFVVFSFNSSVEHTLVIESSEQQSIDNTFLPTITRLLSIPYFRWVWHAPGSLHHLSCHVSWYWICYHPPLCHQRFLCHINHQPTQRVGTPKKYLRCRCALSQYTDSHIGNSRNDFITSQLEQI